VMGSLFVNVEFNVPKQVWELFATSQLHGDQLA
jgi:hypothetical protein